MVAQIEILSNVQIRNLQYFHFLFPHLYILLLRHNSTNYAYHIFNLSSFISQYVTCNWSYFVEFHQKSHSIPLIILLVHLHIILFQPRTAYSHTFTVTVINLIILIVYQERCVVTVLVIKCRQCLVKINICISVRYTHMTTPKQTK